MNYNLKTTPTVAGPIIRDYPFADKGVNSVTIEIPYVIENDYYTPAVLNDVISSSCYCVGDQNVSVSDGVTHYSRMYAQVPGTMKEYETFTYPFPGVFNQRKPFIKTVPCEVTLDYYLTGTGGTYATPSDIPIVEAQTYSYSGWSGNVDSSDFYLTPLSVPSITTYFAATGSSVVVEASSLKRHAGNIYERSTKRVKAY